MQQYELGHQNYFSVQVILKSELQQLARQEETKEVRYVGAREPKRYLKKISQMKEKENKLNTMLKMLAIVTVRWWKGHKDDINTFQ